MTEFGKGEDSRSANPALHNFPVASATAADLATCGCGCGCVAAVAAAEAIGTAQEPRTQGDERRTQDAGTLRTPLGDLAQYK
eukprot:CAMPEP_0195073052 /NCGR_PEP_ID=MMETSP0448-20130528/16472_1 /TAXON_ID=66468 /ORGANISM="Heterocapsa triquestra, Strain CCMP 448" /LENGTH=81 /DNA_ID=CAMNT_0040105113 /DNA_START=55 /DNA_END=296 /DNA_ORIENTATION=-